MKSERKYADLKKLTPEQKLQLHRAKKRFYRDRAMADPERRAREKAYQHQYWLTTRKHRRQEDAAFYRRNPWLKDDKSFP